MISVRYKVLAVPYYRCRATGRLKLMLLKDTKSGDWCFAGGGVKQRERLLDAAQRELYEETHGFSRVVQALQQLVKNRPDRVHIHASTCIPATPPQSPLPHVVAPAQRRRQQLQERIIELWATLVFPIEEVDAMRVIKHMTLSTTRHKRDGGRSLLDMAILSRSGSGSGLAQARLLLADAMQETSSVDFVDVDALRKGQPAFESIWDVQQCLCEPIRDIIRMSDAATESQKESESPDQGRSRSRSLSSVQRLEKTPLSFPEWYREFLLFAYECEAGGGNGGRIPAGTSRPRSSPGLQDAAYQSTRTAFFEGAAGGCRPATWATRWRGVTAGAGAARKHINQCHQYNMRGITEAAV